MARRSMIEAIRDAHGVTMEADENVVVFGEDVGASAACSGARRVCRAIRRTPMFRHADQRVGIVGAAVGMAAYGLRPCVEIQFADYMYPAYDQIVSEAARLRYRSAGQFSAPLTIRMPTGGGIFGGETHSQSPEALFTHVAGLTTVIPSNPYDAKGLLLAAILDNDPVIFLEPKRLYHGPFDGDPTAGTTWSSHPLGEVPDGYYAVPLGKARVLRPGAAVTVVAYGTMVHVAEAAAEATGIDAEILDLRTLVPFDLDTIWRRSRRRGDASSSTRRPARRASAPRCGARAGEPASTLSKLPIERVTG